MHQYFVYILKLIFFKKISNAASEEKKSRYMVVNCSKL